MYKQYNTPEERLVLNFDFDVPSNHIVRFISLFVDSMPESEFILSTTTTGRPGHHPRMLLKVLLFAYSRSVFSGRQIARMNAEMIPMKWLTNDEYICYRSINSFRSNPRTSTLIQRTFIYFTLLLKDHHYLTHDALFIDGTKVEADANKYSFVWKKSVEKYDAKLNQNIHALYHELIEQQVQLAMKEDELQTSKGLTQLIQAIDTTLDEIEQAIELENTPVVGGSPNKRRRRLMKKYRRQLETDYLPRKQKYETAKTLFNGRNSYSKTDTDATFMCMKEDPMKNRELKPGYNLQIATHNQFVVSYGIFPNPTDMKTLRPFLNSIETLDLFGTIVADSGYGSEDNYQFVIEELEKEALIPYTMYRKEQTRKYRHDETKRHNWQYNEELDCYTDHQGVQFSFNRYMTQTDKQGITRDFKLYKADKTQATTELDALALTPSGRQRSIQVNPVWESFKQQVKDNLASDSGSYLYGQRKVDVEPVFGFMKRNFGVRRVHVRGAMGVSNDLGLLLMSMNLAKLAGKVLRKGVGFVLFCVFLDRKNKNSEVMSFLNHFAVVF